MSRRTDGFVTGSRETTRWAVEWLRERARRAESDQDREALERAAQQMKSDAKRRLYQPLQTATARPSATPEASHDR